MENNKQFEKLGIEIKLARTKNKLTQKELSVKSGVAESTIVRIENGQSKAHPDVIYKLALALNEDAEKWFNL